MIVLLTGDDQYAIQERLNQYKAEIDRQWLALCYHCFPADDLDLAISVARTPSLTDGKKVVVVEDCQFKQWGDKQLESLQQLAYIPSYTTLVFVATNVDKRLKIYKHLSKYAKVQELTLIPPWRADLIVKAIESQATKIKLKLSSDAVEYLAQAIGNDLTRVASELQKLYIYADNRKLDVAEVKELVSCRTQNSLQLAAAIREGNSNQVLRLLNDLLSRAEPIMVIVSTLLTQFRTWLWVKSAIVSGVKPDNEIAKMCGINNPHRLYYLRQEVANTSINALAQAVTMLLDLEMSIKRGADTKDLLPIILSVSRLFKSNSET
jgi:DNA polymerase-3 subunit delta